MRCQSSEKRNIAVGSSRSRGFTLVELLVVIGIIALLISILLPALNRARMMAKQVACLSQLRQIGNAMLLHAQDHVGYLQVAGYVHGIDANPDGLGDHSMRRYSYFLDGAKQRPMPMSGALGPYLGRRMRTDSAANLLADQSAENSIVRKIFSCPGVQVQQQGISIKSNVGGSWSGPLMYSSYAFNEAVLSYSHNGAPDPRQFECLRGHLSAIRQPTRTVLLCDNYVRGGIGGNPSYFTIYANYCPSTLAEAYFNQNGAGPDKVSFDRVRHHGRMNWLAADMHAETTTLPGPNAAYSDTGPLSDIFVIAQ